jgi:hypothetical protein
MRTNTQEAVLSAYIVPIGKRTPRDAAQDAAELCRIATSLNRLRVSGFVLTNPEPKKAKPPATPASPTQKDSRRPSETFRLAVRSLSLPSPCVPKSSFPCNLIRTAS